MSSQFLTCVAIVTLSILSIPGVGSCEDQGDKRQSVATMSDLIKASTDGRRLGSVPIPAALPEGADIASIEKYVRDHPNYTAYHLLFLLYKRSPKTYEAIPADTKAKVLCSALGNCTLMNDWGYLDPQGSTDEVSAKLVLAIGKPALPYLVPLLDDKRKAYVFGSEEATVAFDWDYRRTDFAYRYVMLILGRHPAFLADPAERDKLIDTLKNDLQRWNGKPPAVTTDTRSARHPCGLWIKVHPKTRHGRLQPHPHRA